MSSSKKGILFVVSAPSGAGKTSLVTEALKRLNAHSIERIVTYTSREARPNETNGKDYHFISPEVFVEREGNGDFLETTRYNNTHYGSPSSALEKLELGTSCVLIADTPGAKVVRKAAPYSVLIWITAPDLNILKNRLKKRATDTPQQIEKRLKIAQQEMDEEYKQRVFNYHIVNDDFDRAVAELVLIIENELKKNA